MGMLDQLDRLTLASSKISTACTSSHSQTGPFTRGLLYSRDPQSTIRDLLPGETGLFSFVHPDVSVPGGNKGAGAGVEEIHRKEVVSATPLKKRRVDSTASGAVEPEVLLEAAMKLLDMYDTLPRYRQHIKDEWDRLKEIRKAIETEKAVDVGDPSLPGSQLILQLQAEEKALEALRPKWKALRDKRDSLRAEANDRLLSKPTTPPPSFPDDSIDEGDSGPSSPSNRLSKNIKSKPGNLFKRNLPPPASLPEPQPLQPPRPAPVPRLAKPRESNKTFFEGEDDILLTEAEDEADGDADATFVLPTMSQSESIISSVASTPLAVDPRPAPVVEINVEETPRPASRPVAPESEPRVRSGKRPKKDDKARESEMQPIVNKIWLTVGDVVLPGHTYGKNGNKIPSLKETISILNTVADLTAPTASESSSASSSSLLSDPSASAGPTPHQILMAYLLIEMLSGANAQTGVPLNATKAHLAIQGQTKGWANGGELGLRAVYACVAKKVVRIERGEGGQVLKFII